MRVTPGEAAQLHQLQCFAHALLAFIGLDLLHAQAKGNVLLHGHVGEQRVALEHHADAALLRAQRHDVVAVQQDLPAVHRGEPGDATQQRGLAAPGGAEQGDEFAALDVAVDVLENRVAGIALV